VEEVVAEVVAEELVGGWKERKEKRVVGGRGKWGDA
jgi:hypothetical protein